MGFNKDCPMCKEHFDSLIKYMSHIKSRHQRVSPEKFGENRGELKWSLREVE